MFPSPICQKKGFCSPNLQTYQEHENKTIEICKVRFWWIRLPVFFLRGMLYNFRRKVYYSNQLSGRGFIFWYLWKTNAFTVNQFYNDCTCWFHPTSLYSCIRNWLLHVLAKDGVSVGYLFVCFILLVWTFYSLLFMITIWTSAGKVHFRLLYASDTAVMGNAECLIWSIRLPASLPPILGIPDFHCHLSRHNNNTRHVSCSACWFSLLTVDPNHRVHRSN